MARVYKYNKDGIKIKVTLDLCGRDCLRRNKVSNFEYIGEPMHLFIGEDGNLYPSLLCYLTIDIDYIMKDLLDERDI